MFILNTKVLDQITNEPIELASIVITDSKGVAVPINGNVVGKKTDVNGKFILPIINDNFYIKVSCVGYTTLINPAIDFENDVIYLQKSNNVLAGVTITANKITASVKNELKGKHFPMTIIVLAGVVAIASFIVYKIVKK